MSLEIILNEQAKKLGQLNKSICCTTSSISDVGSTLVTINSKIPTLSVTRNKSLTGSLVALTSEACISVTLRNNGNSLIYVSGGSITEQTMMSNESIPLFVTNANLISVRGTGTLEYIVDK